MPENFQENQPSEFNLTEITKGYGAVEAAWNSIDGGGVNDRLSIAVNGNKDEFEIFSNGLADILEDSTEPVAELIRKDIHGLSTTLIDTRPRQMQKRGVDAFYQESPEAYMKDFYAFWDKMEGDGATVPDDYLSGIIHRLIRYSLDSIPVNDQGLLDKAWLNEKAGDLIADLTDDDFKEDFTDFTKFLNKLLLQNDYPIWINAGGVPLNYTEIKPGNDTNLGIGNAVQGTHDLFAWLNRVVQTPDTRALLHAVVEETADIFDPDPEAGLAAKLQDLTINLEDHFTIGGSVYTIDPDYSENSSQVYSDAELGQTIREFYPLLEQLMMRSDRPNAIIYNNSKQSPVYPLDLAIDNLKHIGFDPDKIDVERSLSDLMRADIWGRDRVTDPAAWPTTYLESLLFLTHVTSHHGWRDGGDTAEIDLNADPRDAHGHGNYTEELTLNDSLFSIKTHKTLNLLGVYDISLKPGDGNHHYRTRTPFMISEIDELHNGSVSGDDKDYRFFFDQNYGVLQFLAGPGAGDLGAPDGGNPSGKTLGMNQYRAYAPNGLHETQLSAWTMGWGVRACFGGEGPYYFADPNAETVSLNGRAYRKYLRPNGRTYALVSRDGAQYIYPAEEGDMEDPATEVTTYNKKRERDNRYKYKWRSDYYISHYSPGQNAQDHFFTIDNRSGNTAIREISGTDGSAGSLSYTELIAEDDPNRACASAEEAFFRNYQWVMNEKKMVLIIPLHMDLSIAGKAIIFKVLECHGWSGLANLRKFRENHIWAKKGTDGLSPIPGDYRMEVVTAATPLAAMFINDNSVYGSTLDCGNATPSIVGHNLPALYRLGFPLSPAMSRSNVVTDYVLGSQDFEVGDAIWEKRNAFMPMLFSLLAGLREYTPPYDPDGRAGINSGMRIFLNQIPILIKPLFYYHQSGSTTDPPNTWIPKVHAVEGRGSFRGNPFLQSSAEFYDGTPNDWFGSMEEMRHFQPAMKKTILNVLIDSDLSDPQKRYNGLLPHALKSKTISNLLKLLLHPSTGTIPLEQLASSIKITKGELIAINEMPESAKNMVYPSWMFADGITTSIDDYGVFTEYEGIRDEDFVLDDLLDMLVGHDAIDERLEGYGLANYPDNRVTEKDWQEFYDAVDTISDLLHTGTQYTLTPNLLGLIDRIFGRRELFTKEEIRGLFYGAGKLFGYYDGEQNQWVYQGTIGFDDLYKMLCLRLPAVHDVIIRHEGLNVKNDTPPITADNPGDNYYAQLVLLSNLAQSDGVLEFLINTVTVPQDWETIFFDLNRFLEGKDISDTQSELWPTLVKLLREMSKATAESKDEVVLDGIYEHYGFQVN